MGSASTMGCTGEQVQLGESDESRSDEDGDVEDRAAGMGEDTEAVRVVDVERVAREVSEAGEDTKDV